ncbi:MAG: DNA topoisomerase VI, partial [Candidatus ainarchaeum sp.]|nr:DNA topoisomerase VI [Candidatus ainarchaeum sp.]
MEIDMDEKTSLQKLKNLGKEMYIDVISGESPKFETPLRTKTNISYDEKVECLKLGEKKELRKFLSVSQARTFMQTLAVANKTKKFLEENLHTSIRGLYYQLKFSLGENLDESLFEEQSESNALIEDLEATLGVKREDLHLTTDRKGVLAGPVKIKDKFAGEENIIDGEKQGRSGWMIPS